MMDVAKILYELERTWEVGSSPGRQAAEFNAALREPQQILQQQVTASRAPGALAAGLVGRVYS